MWVIVATATIIISFQGIVITIFSIFSSFIHSLWEGNSSGCHSTHRHIRSIDKNGCSRLCKYTILSTTNNNRSIVTRLFALSNPIKGILVVYGTQHAQAYNYYTYVVVYSIACITSALTTLHSWTTVHALERFCLAAAHSCPGSNLI